MRFSNPFSGPQELKVFVGLASISAGKGDMEVAKVKCLHAATTGYAPLIFNLGNMCDYRKFLEKCKLVWKELKTDPGLPIKLVRKMNFLIKKGANIIFPMYVYTRTF